MKLCGFQFRPLFALLVLGSALVFVLFVFYKGNLTFDLVKLPYRIGRRGGTKESSKIRIEGQQPPRDIYSDPARPLLTLFTTFKNTKSRWQIHWNVLKNWASFWPKIRPILFIDDTDANLISFASGQNWTVVPVPAKSRHGTPQLKDMFFMSQKLVPGSVFYGYANGDLLFDVGLGDTLETVAKYLDQLRRSLVIGMRTNVNINGRKVVNLETVVRLAKHEGKLFRTDAEDYFLIAHNEFPWNVVPNLVIGRPAYDNFLVATAVKYAMSVVDATKTLVAVHQTGNDGNFAGHKNRDSNYNSNVIGRFNYYMGLTTSAKYITQYNARGRVELWKKGEKGKPVQMLTPSLATTTTTTTTTTKTPTITLATSVVGLQNRSRFIGQKVINHDIGSVNASQNKTGDIHPTIAFNKTANTTTPNINNHTGQDETIQQTPGRPRDIRTGQLLTLFTIFSPTTTMRQMHLNVLRNWASFHPRVTTVLFTVAKDGALAATAKSLNWTVLPVSERTPQLVPPIKEMFVQVKSRLPGSLFYGYIPCDLLFDEGLEDTITVVGQYLQHINKSLVVGSRSTYPVEDGHVLADPADVRGLIQAKQDIFRIDHESNFLIGHSQFPWEHIPDLVMGRPAYDNYLVALAIRHKFSVIDATQTLLAIQQMPTDPELVSNEAEDFDPNLLGPAEYSEGFVASAQYETRYDPDGAVELWQRQKNGGQSTLVSPPTGDRGSFV